MSHSRVVTVSLLLLPAVGGVVSCASVDESASSSGGAGAEKPYLHSPQCGADVACVPKEAPTGCSW